MGLMYRPRSSEKIMPRLPPPPLEAEDANFITSGSSATPSTSNMNSSGTAGAWSSCSSGCSSSCCSCSCSCSPPKAASSTASAELSDCLLAEASFCWMPATAAFSSSDTMKSRCATASSAIVPARSRPPPPRAGAMLRSIWSRKTSSAARVGPSSPLVPTFARASTRRRKARFRKTLRTDCSQSRLNCIVSERIELTCSQAAMLCSASCADGDSAASSSARPAPRATCARTSESTSGGASSTTVWPFPMPRMR
mmetsp:Transcript_31021/g.102298  ORF Transcript_31021/g.102298 Transcript_31021/m.102298 type:complete len:253 (+) Transcript_31021:425-1183(+)